MVPCASRLSCLALANHAKSLQCRIACTPLLNLKKKRPLAVYILPAYMHATRYIGVGFKTLKRVHSECTEVSVLEVAIVPVNSLPCLLSLPQPCVNETVVYFILILLDTKP